MKKYTLIKFFKGEASEKEIDSITSWVNESSANKKYFAREKELFTVISSAEQSVAENLSGGSIKRSKIIRYATYFAAAAAVAAVFFFAGYAFHGNSGLNSNPAVSVLSHKAVMHTLYTERGVKGYVVLPDSSRVWLNSDSKITYPEEFTGKTRNVSISGEAYFEVQKDSLHPMIVMTNKDFSLEVLGTSFNIKSYDNEDNAMATLYTGSIKMHYRDANTSKISTIKLKPNETFNYTPKLAEVKQFVSPKPENDKAWKDGALVFEDTPMPEVIKMLERWHGTKFIVKNDEIYQYKLSAVFTSESIVQIMEIMKLIMPVKYSCKNNVVTLE
jgi:transmembrane sensor